MRCFVDLIDIALSLSQPSTLLRRQKQTHLPALQAHVARRPCNPRFGHPLRQAWRMLVR